MSLHPGSRLGPFEILSAIGAGGMGEVYRARDTKLGREVAIKVLPEEFVADAERRARFEREARLVSQLNHPNICVLYHVSDAPNPDSRIPNPDPIQFLVLELVEGETLRERLIRGALPLDEALRYATAIAEALEAAHEKGIIHRDLKPSNIKITPVGTVKVLDFGLAKVAGSDGSGPDLTQSPTITMGGTHDGVILGTAAYMSPEQARGQLVDKRADIWAFGCVLYEMLAGRPAFEGDTISDTIASVMRGEPDWSVLPADLSPTVQMYLRRTLQKNPRDRVHDVADLRLAIGGAFEVAAGPIYGRTEVAGGKKKSRWQSSAIVVMLVALGAIAAGSIAWALRPVGTSNLGAIRFTIEPPPMPSWYMMAVSPDGRTIAFAAAPSGGPGGPTMLFVRPIGSLEARPLPGTENALTHFWSPDSRYIGFWAGSPARQLKIIEATGGQPRVLLDLPGGLGGGTWNTDGVIVFSSGGVLHRVPATGGVPTPLTTLDRSAGEEMHLSPQFLPDGRHFLYLAVNTDFSKHAVFMGSLDSGQPIRLMGSESRAAYAPPNFLLFVRQQTLLAQRFDVSTLTLSGEPMPVAEGLFHVAELGRAAFSVSDAGTLIYRKGGVGERWLVWIDRSGKASSPIGESLRATFIKLSPDGSRVAFGQRRDSGQEDIWIYDLQRNLKSPVTNSPESDHMPVWSPDGVRVAFDSHRHAGGGGVIYQTRADGVGSVRELIPPEPGMGAAVLEWTSDYIVFSKGPLNGTGDLWAQPLVGDRKPFRYLSQAGNGTLSPNGRWLAYVANEAGTNQVIVQSFPDPSRSRRVISSKGGTYPRWRRDGRELFYLDPDRKMIAVSIDTNGPLAVGKSTELFYAPIQSPTDAPGGTAYDVTADGQRFLFSAQEEALGPAPPITVVLNWTAALKK